MKSFDSQHLRERHGNSTFRGSENVQNIGSLEGVSGPLVGKLYIGSSLSRGDRGSQTSSYPY